ncbi:Oidioi.mRNA.OKI2018_I69.chr1.g1821.t1.cds [Oikopleura dioica]|uniref:Oidioi.mRNA.OKI2018_I69.chr1.g1821.t1.cds n=1 Tax=Oikopleura dioica TaxID=34765 RepID=A0ABN7SVD8_OIKDI|nr:Oidioi.mRNA.OKI2018_I69.chr1.g1821.t1.cds [Oikopleura dioica]
MAPREALPNRISDLKAFFESEGWSTDDDGRSDTESEYSVWSHSDNETDQDQVEIEKENIQPPIDTNAPMNPFTIIQDAKRYFTENAIFAIVNHLGNVRVYGKYRNKNETPFTIFINKSSGKLVFYYPDSNSSHTKRNGDWTLKDIPLDELQRLGPCERRFSR